MWVVRELRSAESSGRPGDEAAARRHQADVRPGGAGYWVTRGSGWPGISVSLLGPS